MSLESLEDKIDQSQKRILAAINDDVPYTLLAFAALGVLVVLAAAFALVQH